MILAEIKRMNLKRYVKEKYGIECNRKGYAICPFHPDEKNPSFQIHFYDGIWRWTDWHLDRDNPDFSGTIIDLVARIESLSLTDAINRLMEEFREQLIEEYKQKRRTRQNPATEASDRGTETDWERTEYIYKGSDGNEVYKKVKL